MKNKWQLYSWHTYKTYPSVIYFWVNPEGVIVHQRSIEPIGFAPAFPLGDNIGKTVEYLQGIFRMKAEWPEIKKVKTKMTDDQLSQGWLLF
jgi:hypothetical protein